MKIYRTCKETGSYIDNMDKIPLIETESRDESIELVHKDIKNSYYKYASVKKIFEMRSMLDGINRLDTVEEQIKYLKA